MTPTKAAGYAGLGGDAFLDAVFAARDLDQIEGLWRADEPALRVRLAPRIAALGDPTISDLLLDEVLDGPGAELVATAIVGGMSSGRPRLTPAGVERLVTRLADDAVLPAGYQQRRAALIAWALGQKGAAADQFARKVATAEIALPDPALRLAAYERARANKALATAMAGDLEAQVSEDPSTVTWPRSFEFVNDVLAGVSPVPAKVKGLVSTLLRSAPVYFGNPDFGEPFTGLAVDHAVPTLDEMLAAGALSGPGMTAVIRLVDQIPDLKSRRRLFLLAVTAQSHLYPLPDQVNQWTTDDWAFRLDAILESNGERPPNIVALMTQAPSELAPRVVALGAKYDHAAEPPIRSAVVTQMTRHLDQVDASDVDAVAAIYPWPTSETDADGLEYLSTLLEAINDAGARLAAVAAGLATGRLSPMLAPKLLLVSQSAELLHRPEMTPALIRSVSPALYDERQDEFFAAVRSNQDAAFSIDLAAGMASRSPKAAFSNAAFAYDGLDDAGREELLSLLEANAEPEQEPVVARYVSDTKPAARPRRVRAIALVGRLLPKGGTVPDYLTAALGASHKPILDAALAAIGTAQPRDPEMARGLREIASADGPVAGAARKTLDAMTTAYLADLDEPIDIARRRETLALLGAAARRECVPALLGHVGENTPEDEPLVHRSAGEALAEAASHQRFEPADVDQLGRLIEEEGDTQAREALGNALARAVLGEEAAINVLYDELLGRPPSGKHTPDALFGPEKAPLIRALTLYHSDAAWGEKGWPGAILQLDLIAEKLTRAAYRFVGTSQAIKTQIANDPREPDYGSLLTSLQGKLSKAEGPLTTLHLLRSSHTEYPHSGKKPTQATMTTALEAFRLAAPILVGVIEQNA